VGFHHELNKTSEGGFYVIIPATLRWLELEALQEVENRGITHIIFETYSKCVVDAIYNLSIGSLEFSSIICNIKYVLL
jgi:hypothetical protein